MEIEQKGEMEIEVWGGEVEMVRERDDGKGKEREEKSGPEGDRKHNREQRGKWREGKWKSDNRARK